MVINVSDLYDGLHGMAAIAVGVFGLGPDSEPPADEFLDQLEVDLFLPACARRIELLARRSVEPDDVAGMIRLREADGSFRPGAAGRYHSHGFEADDADLRNQVLAGNLLPRARAEVELVVEVERR